MKWEKPKHWLRQKKTKAVIASTALVFALLAAQPDIAVADMYVRDHEIRKVSEPVCSIICLPAGMGLIKAAAGSSAILSGVQEFTITIATSSTSNTATISSISTSNSMIVWGGNCGTGTTTADPSVYWCRLTLTNSTTVTAVRNTADASETATCSGSVVTWNSSAVQSIQYSTIVVSSGSTSNTGSISSITIANAGVQFLGLSSTGTSVDLGRAYHRLNITSTTQVTATRSTSTTGDVTVSFVVMEFKSGILNSNTQENTMSGTTTTSDTNTITSVTTGQSWLMYGGQNGAYSASSNGQYILKGFLTNGTTITVNCQTSHTWAFTATVIEFKSANVQLIQRSQDVVSDATLVYEDVTISSVNTTKAFYNHLSETLTTGSSASPRFVQPYGNLTSSTNKRLTRGTASTTVTPTVSSEVIELI